MAEKDKDKDELLNDLENMDQDEKDKAAAEANADEEPEADAESGADKEPEKKETRDVVTLFQDKDFDALNAKIKDKVIATVATAVEAPAKASEDAGDPDTKPDEPAD